MQCLGAVLLGLGIGAVVEVPAPAFAPNGAASAANVPQHSASFSLCHTGGGQNCVVDGDTFYLDGEKIRIADIDAPETHPARCAEEDALGTRATTRLAELLGAGSFTLDAADRPTDRYGRRLAIVTRDGQSIGGMLVSEGLAREWEGARRPWC